MDAIKMLKNDHHKVKDLIREYADAGDDAFRAKQQIADQIFAELEVHTTLEEEIFYPAVKAKTDDEGKGHVAEGMEEHHVVKILIAELKTLTPEDEAFAAKFKVLSENVEHHIKEEEDELLPDAKKKLGHDGIEVLGDQMDARRQELQTAVAAGQRPVPVSDEQ
jgi:iron-sulfur cluster repair protein YtfE (RIC family)